MISGPHLQQSLLLIECQELCLEDAQRLVCRCFKIWHVHGATPPNNTPLLLILFGKCRRHHKRCTGIAFPGCYLLNKTSIKLLSSSSYSLMVKEKAPGTVRVWTQKVLVAPLAASLDPCQVQPRVKSAIGYSQADSYNNNSIAQLSYLNRPLSCAVDSAGDLIFTDNNHIIRSWVDLCK